jgi:hypothetical protein
MKYKCAISGNMCPFICYKEEEVGVKSYIAFFLKKSYIAHKWNFHCKTEGYYVPQFIYMVFI